MKKLCNGDDCFTMVEIFDDYLRMDGTPHKYALLCHKCITPEQYKTYKNFKKRIKKKRNKLINK